MDSASDEMLALASVSAQQAEIAVSLKTLALANQQGEAVLKLLEGAVEAVRGPAEEGKGESLDLQG